VFLRLGGGCFSGSFTKESENRNRKEEMSLSKRAPIAIRSFLVVFMLAATAFPVGVRAISEPPTTLILVRHAEKAVVPPENKDPDLSPAGQARAQELVKMFGDTGIAAIYATQYKRTQQTVKPLADKLGLAVTKVNAKETGELVKQIRARNAGRVIFIAGHNNTVPEIIAAMGGPQLPIIPETEYDNLYFLTVYSDGPAKLIKMKYGSAVTPVGNQGMMKP
jgi:2,3-bisphosphoglycerate-dependent phosphoglycerate mutase